MLETAYAQLRFATSLLLGRPFHIQSLERLVDALVATRREFGPLVSDAAEFVSGPELDVKTRREVQLRRFRAQSRMGQKETVFYRALFAEQNLDPGHITWEKIASFPVLTKHVLRHHLPDLIRRNQNPNIQTMTTGTTGRHTGMVFTARELEIFVLLSALGLLAANAVSEEDVVQVSTSARALLGNSTFMGGCQRVGALVYQTGIVAPSQALEMLAQKHYYPAKASQATVLMTYPSYMGMLLYSAQMEGYRLTDFGLRRVVLGGEIVTDGIRKRCSDWFEGIEISEGYGISETWPFGGTRCEEGHLHFEPSQGLMEVISLETGRPAAPGEIGSLVLTPFAPYRESAVLLRYDTQDLVQVLGDLCECTLRHQPATTPLLGKLRLSVAHDNGWTCPRHVLEAVEGVDSLPLPARCGFWAEGDGVAVEVAVPRSTQLLRSQIGDALEENGVPVRALHLVAETSELRKPLPWRGDLREMSLPVQSGQLTG